MPKRTPIDSFIERFSSPFLELLVAISINYILLMLNLTTNALNNIMNQTKVSTEIIELLPAAILIASTIDIIRNLAVAFKYPGHAIAHILGELISLAMIYKIVLKLAPNAFYSCIISAITMLIGIFLRATIELQKSQEYHSFY